MKYYLMVFIAVAVLTACNEKHEGRSMSKEETAAHLDSLKSELLQTDIEFSQLSEQKGRNAAFTEYADSGATMLRPYSMPVVGKNKLMELFSSHPDTSFTLTWVPIYVDVARSGEMGYTYGTYSLERDGKASGGTYCTLWKKRHKENKWKFVLDTGNEGVKPEDRE